MAVMLSRVLSSLVFLLCVLLLPAVWADYCSSYRDEYGGYHDDQSCFLQHCCGTCNNRYCCSDKTYRLSKKKQDDCDKRPSYGTKNQTAVILGSILGTVVPIVLCVGLIICCVVPCCLCYKKCRKGRQRHRSVGNTSPIGHVPAQHPVSPSIYQPSYPGYQPVPVQPGFGGPPMPTAPPPSYLEATDPAHSGHPMQLFPTPPYAPTPHSEEFNPLPYNPSYGANP